MPNRLISETSPYLLQHAHNPVDWYPWGEEALQKAKAENKPILVSIGYSACHWCHVMERESFEKEATAAVMNEHFVNIKIDREERPDLDHIYMDAVQTISGSGGWPLNVFLTPDARPFFGGTYFPPVKAYNRSSWTDVLLAIHQAWADKPEEIVLQAENLTAHLQNAGLFGSLAKGDTQFSEEQLATAVQALLQQADKVWGGFGQAPKFPQTFSIQFLLRQYYHEKAKGSAAGEAGLQQALLSLDKMIMGGLYDQLGGGFARYSTDAQWLAPHFEKMLYDNALLVSVLSEAYALTQNELYKQTIEQTLDFAAAEWQDSDGGFFSAYDADSEGEEGRFYTWQYDEIKELIPDDAQRQLFCEYYDISPNGNWEHTNILWVQQPLEDFCRAKGHSLEAAEAWLVDGAAKLMQYRALRIKPLLDDKKLMSWNALMITACCKAWAALGRPAYLQMAEKAAAFIEQNLKAPDGLYRHNYKAGRAANPAFLDDVAAYLQALGHLQEATGNTTYLETARSLMTRVLEQYGDTEGPFFFFTPSYQTDVIMRKKEIYDGAVPSGNSLMAQNLFYFGVLLNEPAWKKRSADMMGLVAGLVSRYPTSFGLWAQLLQWLVYGVKELAVVGPEHQNTTAELLLRFFPDKILQQSSIANPAYPLLAEKPQSSASTMIYLCQHYACQQPQQSVEGLFATMLGN